jgi:predicted deacetylase
MDIRNHPEFVAFLNSIPRTEIAIHGLHHINRGYSVSAEFQHQERATCASMLTQAIQIFEESGLRYVRGLQPPDGIVASNCNKHAGMSEPNGWHQRGISRRLCVEGR